MTTYGYKRTVVGAHYGWRDWLVQRITALIMILFTLTVIAQLCSARATSVTHSGQVFLPPNG